MHIDLVHHLSDEVNDVEASCESSRKSVTTRHSAPISPQEIGCSSLATDSSVNVPLRLRAQQAHAHRPERLQLARQYSADAVINGTVEDVMSSVCGMTAPACACFVSDWRAHTSCGRMRTPGLCC